MSKIGLFLNELCVFVCAVQLTGETVGEVKAVADMHQRKAEMAKHSDAFIALPGWFVIITANSLIFFHIIYICKFIMS